MKPILTLLVVCLLSLFSSPTHAERSQYQLGPGDEIEVLVYQEPDLKTQTMLSQSGHIDVPLIGQIHLEGKTLDEAKVAIEKRFKDGYLVNPDVTLIVREYRPFFIHGEVKSPGSYKYQAEINLEQAIAMAGGLKDRASRSEWQIWRGYPQVAFKANKDEKIMPGDVIKIDKSFF